MPRVFLSHAAADKPLVDDLKGLLQRCIGLQPNEFFYSSGKGTGVPGGSNFVQYIRGQMDEAAFVVAVITPAFRGSEFCLAELGAVWVKADQDFFPLCVPSVDRADLSATLTGIQVQRIDERASLAELLQRVAKHFGREYNAAACDEELSVFMSTLNARLAALTGPETVPASDFETAQATIEFLGAQLAEARDEAETARNLAREIEAAKTQEEVEALARNLDAGLESELQALITRASKALRGVPSEVTDAIPYELKGDGMPWPDRATYDYDNVARIVDDGQLRDNGDGTVSPREDWPDVRAAMEAARELQDYLLRLDYDEEDWFKKTYEVPPDLRQGAAFRALLL